MTRHAATAASAETPPIRGSRPTIPTTTPRGGWVSSWVPFIEDLHGAPTRLVQPACYANHEGIQTLVAVVLAHDEIVRQNEYRRWRTDQGLD